VRARWFAALVVLLGGCPRPSPHHGLGEGTARVRSELVTDGALRRRVARPDAADLVLFYGGEQQGSMEPCGCPANPRGSLYRLGAYVEASRRVHEGVPDLLLNPGYWLDDTRGTGDRVRADVAVANGWMLRGLDAGGWDALNLTLHDLVWLEQEGARPERAVSANIRPVDGGGWPARWLEVDRGGLRVGVTGVSGDRLAPMDTDGFHLLDPVASVQGVVAELQGRVDLIVVLAYGVDRRGRELVELPGVDVLVEADGYRERYPPFVGAEAIWVRSHYQTRRLGELRLVLGTRTTGVDRKIELDDRIPSERTLARIAREARLDVAVTQREVLGW